MASAPRASQGAGNRRASHGEMVVRDRMRLKKQHPELKKAVKRHDIVTMNRTTGGIGGVLDTLSQRIAILDAEIAADEAARVRAVGPAPMWCQ
eukprot:g4474.t1